MESESFFPILSKEKKTKEEFIFESSSIICMPLSNPVGWSRVKQVSWSLEWACLSVCQSQGTSGDKVIIFIFPLEVEQGRKKNCVCYHKFIGFYSKNKNVI